MQPRSLPAQGYLRQCFDYDPATGRLTWLKRPRHHFDSDRAWWQWNGRYAGTAAGSPSGGYVQVGIGGGNWRASRVIWVWVTGENPADVDHKDRDGTNNRWDNLRNAGTSLNLMNRIVQTRNKLGIKGVFLDQRRGRYIAKVTFRGEEIIRKAYETIEEARTAYAAAAFEVAGEYFRA